MDDAEARDLAHRAIEGSRRARGRAISLIEDRGGGVTALLREIYPRSGHAYTVGITGPPGAGKSTVVDELVREIRESGRSVAVLAVDPNSPFTGGAILGDRVRMMRHSQDPEVFIRSMGARGHLGGLALSARNCITLLDACGMDIILVETVGVGQSELEVAETTDTTVVVIPPGLGDGVQAIKAGIMEIAHIFVVNKADHPYASRTVADIRELLRMSAHDSPWTAPIVQTVATRNEGIHELWRRIQQHRAFLESSGELTRRRRDRVRREIARIAEDRMKARFLMPRLTGEQFDRLVDEVNDRHMDPFTAAERIVPAPVGAGTEE